VIANIDDLEDMLAAVNAADEAARLVALRAWKRPDDLVEADIIRTKLAILWKILHRERETYMRSRSDDDATDE
jgi:hypothetical protein